MLAKLEQYNGLGYAARGRPSPYIWSGTDQYSPANMSATESTIPMSSTASPVAPAC